VAKSWALPWLGVLVVLGVLELLARGEVISPRYFPPPS
jgi:ABC-type nitrate/sulfonate/bicarbonate transport system permease component